MVSGGGEWCLCGGDFGGSEEPESLCRSFSALGLAVPVWGLAWSGPEVQVQSPNGGGPGTGLGRA